MKKGYFFATLRIIVWVLIIGWMSIVAIDFSLVKRAKEPIFCLKNEVIEESDGKVFICHGLGYKYYDYVKTTYTLKKFVPFWKEAKNEEND